LKGPDPENDSRKRNGKAPTMDAGLLRDRLERLKDRLGMGYEVGVEWLPGTIKFRDGRRLDEEVIGNTILIYAEDPDLAYGLLAHGFTEWLLNQHTKRYRLLINKLIELFEQIHYEEKEKLVEAIARLMFAKDFT
jgi:hypothetical protein